jgi:hypothetical protein
MVTERRFAQSLRNAELTSIDPDVVAKLTRAHAEALPSGD